MKTTTKVKRLVESAVMLAIATVLSMIKIIHMPAGGSVTAAAMLPVMLIAYRHGVKWGLFTGFVYGIIEQLLGLSNLQWVTTWQSILAVIFLDYLIAYMGNGLGGSFRKVKDQASGLVLGIFLACVVRFICHVIPGATVWAGLSIPTEAALIYSLSYNATYMIPETIITMIVGYYVGSILDVRHDRIRQIRNAQDQRVTVLKIIGGLLVVAALIFDTIKVFVELQDAESGEFFIMGLKSVNWHPVLIVTGTALAAAIVLFIISVRLNKKRHESHEA